MVEYVVPYYMYRQKFLLRLAYDMGLLIGAKMLLFFKKKTQTPVLHVNPDTKSTR